MTVFISHSFGNKPDYENVTDTLDVVDVPRWDPALVQSGDSLREQLRDAIHQCGACIFVATHDSVRSSWCGAELGAFWGDGRPIIVYLAHDRREMARGAADQLLRNVDITDALRAQPEPDGSRQILWVDDHPENNAYEREAMSLGPGTPVTGA